MNHALIKYKYTDYTKLKLHATPWKKLRKNQAPSNLITELSQNSYGKDLEKFPLKDTRHLDNKKRVKHKVETYIHFSKMLYKIQNKGLSTIKH